MVQAKQSSGYAWFVVAILMVAYVFSFIDRQILNLMVGPIRSDLGISDTEMSLLMGFAFALFYTIMGIPLGRLADSKSRRGVIAAGVVLWSVMTALCGTARHYWTLFMFRVGVGVGEAALSPAAYSMISDYFPPEKRATAISVYSMGIYIGSGLAFLLGGLVIQYAAAHGEIVLPLIGETRPWQLVFFIIGGAGILFSFAFLLIKEPPRTGTISDGNGVPFREVVNYLWLNRRTVLCHNFGYAMIAMASYGTTAWIPTFFVRVHDWSASDVGLIFGSIVMVFGAAGIVTGGKLTDHWLGKERHDAAMRVGMWAAIIGVVTGAGYILAPNGTLAAFALAPAVFALSMPFGSAAAAVQEIVPNEMRGQASAVYLFVVNLIGLGVGPTAVALVTDFVFQDDQAVGWSILLVGTLSLLAGAFLLAAGLEPFRDSRRNLARTWARTGA